MSSFSIPASVSQSEGNSGTTNFAFPITRTGALASAAGVTATVGPVTANAADFVGGAVPGPFNLTFAGGEATRTLNVAVQGDVNVESDELFTVTLSAPYTVGTIAGTGVSSATIVNDDTTPALTPLPQQSSLVAHWSAASITPQADNSNLTAWVDRINGLSAIPATTAPKYRTASVNGKPSVQFNGAAVLTPNAVLSGSALNAATLSGNWTIIIMMMGPSSSDSEAAPFASFFGTGKYRPLANASQIGYLAANANQPGPYLDYACGANEVISISHAPGTFACINGMAKNELSFQTGNSFGGDIGIGGYSNGFAPFVGHITDILVWDRVLTLAERAQAEMALRDALGVAYPWASLAKFDVCDGDSITTNYTVTASQSWPSQVATARGRKPGTWMNVAVGGRNTVNQTASIPAWSPVLTQIGKPGIVSQFEFYNELGSRVAGQEITDMVDYLTATKALGCYNILGTSTDFGSALATAPNRTRQANYNAYWDNAANRAGLVDGYAPIHLNANIGVVGAATSGSSYVDPDLIHLLPLGETELKKIFQPLMVAAA